MKIENIAIIAHEVNRAYCQSLGDNSQPKWEEAPDWQKNSAIAGVEFHIENPNADPRRTHERWMGFKISDGWKYGPIKDADKKEHPCIVEYSELPQEQKAKDFIFKAIVNTLTDYLE